jgi:hypothetical protein
VQFFFKVELSTRDGRQIERLPFAGDSLDTPGAEFAAFGKKSPRARWIIRQRTRVEELVPRAP